MNSELSVKIGLCCVGGLEMVPRSPLNTAVPDLSDCVVHQEKPWLLEVWEPLHTKAPCPDKTQPYCCYINTVIFYVRPFIVRPWHRYWICNGKRLAEKPGSSFEKWDEIKTRLQWDDVVRFGLDTFAIGSGTVLWHNKRWWMRRWARRRQDA